MRSRVAIVALALLGGCGDDAPVEPPPPCADCTTAGVAPELCGAGFEPDGARGCTAVLPSERCPPGSMAVPGDTACREIAPCGSGTWGEIPLDASTEHVDASYLGGGSDGSADKPWTSIGEAVTAAAPGAIVAIAAGNYAEDVTIGGKPVRLWGRCPAMVQITGSGSITALGVISGAAGTEIRGVAVTGSARGLVVAGSPNVLVEQVWAHDTGLYGVEIDSGTSNTVLRSSLIEGSAGAGVFVLGGELSVEATLARGTRPHPQGFGGRGVNAQALCPGGDCSTPVRAHLTLRGSLVEDNQGSGVYVTSSDALIEATLVRGTTYYGVGDSGRGLSVVVSCQANDDCNPSMRSDVTARSTVIEDSLATGVLVLASDATFDSLVVRRTSPLDSGFGYGMAIVDCGEAEGCAPGARANMTMSGSLVEDNSVAGVIIGGSDATIEGSLVRRTAAGAAGFGDGVTVQVRDPGAVPASLHVTASRVEDSARAGISSFGAAVTTGDLVLQCSGFDFDGEPWLGLPFDFEVIAPNLCGCPETSDDCLLVSANLAPPDAL